MALYEVDKFSADRKAIRVDAVASASHERLIGTGEIGQATNRGTQHMLGVQVTIPITTGGLRSAKQEEAIVLADRVLLERDQAALTLERGVQSGHAMLASAESKHARVTWCGRCRIGAPKGRVSRKNRRHSISLGRHGQRGAADRGRTCSDESVSILITTDNNGGSLKCQSTLNAKFRQILTARLTA
jgi:hypothetical protein